MFPDIYQVCNASLSVENGETPTTDAIVQCMSQTLSGDVGAREFSRILLLIYSAALVFMMQSGFAMVCAGAVRKKNVQNTMLKNLLDACGASLAFFTIGFAFAFGDENPGGDKTFLGTKHFFLIDQDDYSFFLFQYAFSAASATIVAGTLVSLCETTLCFRCNTAVALHRIMHCTRPHTLTQPALTFLLHRPNAVKWQPISAIHSCSPGGYIPLSHTPSGHPTATSVPLLPTHYGTWVSLTLRGVGSYTLPVESPLSLPP